MRAILTYHSIDDSGSAISVPPARFRCQMEWLLSEGVQVVPMDDLLRLPDSSRAAALTFDDGIGNLVTEGLPVLEDLGWSAMVFVVTGRVGTDNRWHTAGRRRVPTLPLLGWDELARLEARNWTIGSHSRNHRRLPDCTDTQLDEELQGAAEDLESALGTRPGWFAYPYGALDSRVAGRTAGSYASACTTDLRPLGPTEDPMRLPRIDAWYLTGPVRRMGWGSPPFRRHLRWRATLRAVRQLAP